MQQLSHPNQRQRRLVGGLVTAVVTVAVILAFSSSGYLGLLAQDGGAEGVVASAAFDTPTTSSPIAMSQDKSTIWVVNPDDGSVSVLGNLDSTPSLLTTVKNVGEEPQAIALDTGVGVAQRAYVVSPPDNRVTILKVSSLNPFTVVVEKRITTGAEPWNVVASPDGARVFVANSAQDTITIIRSDTQSIVGNVNLRSSACNVDDAKRRFQPRGLAVTLDGTRLFVARFLSFTKPGGIQATDEGKEGVVCQIDLPADVATVPTTFRPVRIAAMDTGFKIDANKDGTPDPTSAYPNQMQSIVVYGTNIYLPNIAASTTGPLKFNVDTQSFVNVVDISNATTPADAPTKAINMHLGARVPESGKDRIFFSNPWAIGFRNNAGTVNAYAVSAGSDLLVKLNVDTGTGKLNFTGGVSTTRYIDLNDPDVTATKGRSAGKNPLGLVIRNNKAFVMNYVSRNVSVVNLDTDSVESAIETTALPPAGSTNEQLLVGAEIFFSARGHFDRPQNTTVPTSNRLSSEGWQNCASCHFAGWTDGNVWSFNAGPRKSVPLNSTWSPHNPDDQRVLNYSAIFDEVQDFELNIRNVSGPGPLTAQNNPATGAPPKPPVDCAFAPAPAPANTITKTATFDNQHGLVIGDDGDINKSPCTVVAFNKPNGGRPQVTVTLPGSNKAWPALDSMKEWVRFAIRNPEGALTTEQLTNGGNTAPNNGGSSQDDVRAGRRLFFQANCQSCHGGTKWTTSTKDFASPPAAADLVTEAGAANTVQAQFLNRFLADIGSFELGTTANPIGTNVGAPEKNEGGLNALGKDHNNDGKGNGFNIPSLLSLNILPPYYHNGACETLACVVSNQKHRTGNGKFTDVLANAADQAKLVAWLETLDADTRFPTDLSVRGHDIFLDPPVLVKGQKVTVGANISLFGTRADLTDLLQGLGLTDVKIRIEADPGLAPVTLSLTAASFKQDFGQAVFTTTWDIPANTNLNRATIKVTIDPENKLVGDRTGNNIATRTRRLNAAAADTTAPKINGVFISDDTPFDNNDLFAAKTNVKVKILASDTGGSGLDSYCIVRYRYKQSERIWEPRDCTNFTPLPAGNNGEFIVDAQLVDLAGVTYAFVWVKDKAGNISGTPGFDVISLLDGKVVEMNRNDVRIFRFVFPAGTTLNLKFKPTAGDIDVSVFDHFRNLSQAPTRCAVSASNGPVEENVNLPGTCVADAEDNLFWLQVEVHAFAFSRFTIETSQVAEVDAAATTATEAVRELPDTPTISGPPLRAGVDEASDGGGGSNGVYLPLVLK